MFAGSRLLLPISTDCVTGLFTDQIHLQILVGAVFFFSFRIISRIQLHILGLLVIAPPIELNVLLIYWYVVIQSSIEQNK